MKTKGQTPAQFFFEHAGYSYDPQKETRLQGRRRCARELARAEANGSRVGLSFQWEQDDTTNRDFTNNGPEYYLWCCACRDSTGNVVASLCGIDFGKDREPWSDPYRRVIEAELAQEATQEIEMEVAA